MVEALANLRREIDSLLAAIRASQRVYVVDTKLLERIQQLFISWLTEKARFLSAGVPVEVVSAADRALTDAVRLTASRSRKAQYSVALRGARKVLVGQLLLEIAKLPSVPAPTLPPSPPTKALTKQLPEIPDISDDLIPNALLGWVDNIRKFLGTHPFDRNVFVMVAYRPHLAPLIKRVKKELIALGLSGIVAKDHRLTDDLYNPIACLLCCNYGVAIFDRAEPAQTHNPNVVYELGMMQLLKRPCVILKHRKLKTMPSDLLHRLYEDYASEDEAADKLGAWWATLSS